jgi:hypothetical protein
MTPPIIYNADPVTGEFIGTAFADPDPLTPGSWLFPAHAYSDEPPAALPGEVAVRSGDGWAVVPDHRGTVYSTETGAAQEYHSLGALPEGLTTTARPSEAHCWSGEGWELDPVVEASLAAAARSAEILDALRIIDAASARPLRAILVGSATDADRARLTDLDSQATALRAELASMESPPAA